MIQVLLSKKDGFKFFYELIENDNKFFGGLNSDGFLVTDENNTYKELMFRTLVNKCMNDFVLLVKTYDYWGVNLYDFGFEKEDDYYFAKLEKLKLPHYCSHK